MQQLLRSIFWIFFIILWIILWTMYRILWMMYRISNIDRYWNTSILISLPIILPGQR